MRCKLLDKLKFDFPIPLYLEELEHELPAHAGAGPGAQVLLVKFVPHCIVMSIWLNQQKKPKNNQGLTTK